MNISEVIKIILTVIGALGGTASKISRQDGLLSLPHGNVADINTAAFLIGTIIPARGIYG